MKEVIQGETDEGRDDVTRFFVEIVEVLSSIWCNAASSVGNRLGHINILGRFILAD